MAPRKKPETPPSEAAALAAALDFVNVAQVEDSQLVYQTHAVMRSKTVMAFDGVLAAGANTEFSDIATAPNTIKLATALKRCKKEYSITQIGDNKQLVVKSGAFRAVVDCLPVDDIAANVWPDNPIADIDDRIKVGFQALAPLLASKTEHVVTCSVLLQAYTMLATDRICLTEYYHGIDLPPGLIVPKVFVDAVAKAKKPLKRFGYSPTSVTFWFEDMSWLRTQLHTEAWPQVGRIFGKEPALTDMPKKLAEAVDAVEKFSINGAVYFNSNEVCSHLDNTIGASFDCANLPGGVVFGLKRLKPLLDIMAQVDWNYDDKYVYFQGENVRSALSKRIEA